jgi:hypothetical protein
MSVWRRLNSMRWYGRWPLKLAIFMIGTALVLFPKVWLIPTVLERYGDMNAALDPEHPGLAKLDERIREELPADAPASDVLQAVERNVCEQIPYAWDWDVWGVAEYLPTVAEVFERGREDCDGRAVVAASLLRRMGYDAWLVSDLLHVWVQTPEGETMSPTGAEKTFVGTAEGTTATVSTGLIRNLGRGFAYGVAVFPLARELVILGLLCMLTMQPWSSIWRRVAGCLLLWIALDTLRDAGRAVALSDQAFAIAHAWFGVGLGLAGWLVLAIRAGDPRRRSVARRPE